MRFIKFMKKIITRNCRIAHKPNKNQWYNKHKRTRADHFTLSPVKVHSPGNNSSRSLLWVIVRTLSLSAIFNYIDPLDT